MATNQKKMRTEEITDAISYQTCGGSAHMVRTVNTNSADA